MSKLRLHTYRNMHMSSGAFKQEVILDQFGREMCYNSATHSHEPTGDSGSANH